MQANAESVFDKMFQDWSESGDSLLDFDPFLIGEGNKRRFSDSEESLRFNKQLLDPSLQDIEPVYKEGDLALYDLESTKLCAESIEDFFFKTKKDIFVRYDYLTTLSKKHKKALVKERELVCSVKHTYLVKYFIDNNLFEENVVRSVAQICAYSDMGFVDVLFVPVDKCPLCVANSGNIFNIDTLLSNFEYLGNFMHKGCVCEFLPVVRSRKDYESLKIDVASVYIGNTLFINFPKELELLFDDNFVQSLCTRKVVFSDISEEVKNNENLFYVVSDEGDFLKVHSNYLGSYSPYDFLKFWVDSNKTVAKEVASISDLSEDSIYFLEGKKVFEKNGQYFDLATGERVVV